MLTFMEWIKESLDPTGQLERAVREYMSTRPEAKKCYYITRPKNMHFDPSNPKHVEEELGTNYDKSLDVIPFKHHPASFTCANVAEGLVVFLRKKGFKARKVAGWYGNAEPEYYAGYAIGLDDPSPPKGFGSNPQQHWWVEVDDYYIDITSSQFHPKRPDNQVDLVIKNKNDAMNSGEYMPVRRFPLGRNVRLPSNVQAMANKILSLKKFAHGHSSNHSDNRNLSDWIEKNAHKYEMPLSKIQDIIASLKASTRPGFYFGDRTSIEKLFGEAYDEIDELNDDSVVDFKPKLKSSKGVVRISRSNVSLSSTYPDDLEKNFKLLRDIVLSKFPDADLSDIKISSEKGGYGSTIHFASASMKDPQRILTSSDVIDQLRKERFSVG